MQEHQVRVVNEKSELDTRINSLSAFINTNPEFANISPDEQIRLKRQLHLMIELSGVLGERIYNF